MNTAPAISVVVPLYNKIAYVERAINSIRAQSWQDFEIVVIDDGSTDGSDAVVKRVHDPRLRLVQQANAGEGAARNAGVRESVAELIAMLDADDEWYPGFLEAVLSLSRRYPAAGVYATGYRSVYSSTFAVDTMLAPDHGDCQVLVHDYFRKARVASIVWASCHAIPRRVYETIGGFIERGPMGCDLDMWGRIAVQYPVAIDCRVLAAYRNDSQGRMVTSNRQRPQFPPFVGTARSLMLQDAIPTDMREDLQEYLNRLLLQYAQSVIEAGDVEELRRVLAEELYPTRVYARETKFLRLASATFPMPLLRTMRRVLNSRWVAFAGNERVDNDVIQRVVGRKY